MVGRPTTTTTGGTSTATTTAMVLAFRELEIAYALKRVLDARQLISLKSGNMAGNCPGPIEAATSSLVNNILY